MNAVVHSSQQLVLEVASKQLEWDTGSGKLLVSDLKRLRVHRVQVLVDERGMERPVRIADVDRGLAHCLNGSLLSGS